MEELNQINIYEVLSQNLPKQNDFYQTDYAEELQELNDFGISTKIQLINLLLKHVDNLMEIDAEELDDFHINSYRKELGEEYVNIRIENKFWFSYSGLLRIALELEFGEKYQDYADARDGI